MEKFFIILIVAVAVGILCWKFLKLFNGDGPACACGDSKDCEEKEKCPLS